MEEFFSSFINGQQPWWVYLLTFLLPFCVFLSIREAFCWFFKINKLVSCLERIETAILETASDSETEEQEPVKRRGPTEL